MSFGKIVNESFDIAWKHKLLWIFGLFAGGGAGVDVTNFVSDDWGGHQCNWDGNGFWEAIEPFYGALTVGLILAVLFAVIVIIACHVISISALIDSVNRIKRGDGRWTFAQAFSTGVDFIFPMLGLIFMSLVVGVALVAVMVVAVVIAAKVGWAAALLVGLIMLPVLMVVIWTISNIVNLSERVMVVRRTGLGNAIEEAFQLFRTNLIDNLLIFLIELGFVIAFVIGGLVIWAIVGIPLAALALLAGSGWIGTAIVIILIGIPISLVVGGFTGTVISNLYTLFYFELVGASSPASSPTATSLSS